MSRHLTAPQLAVLLSVETGARPYYRALAAAVRAAILDGRLPVRVRLPAERHLARTLGVSRTTVTAAYDLLRGGGYLDSRQGAGSWTALPDPASLGPDNPWLVAGGDGLLPMHCAAPAATPLLPAAMAAAAQDLPRHTLGIGYEPVGLPELREAIAARYTARGLATLPEQILVTAGAQHGIHLVMELLLRPGDTVLVESPTYPHALDAARRHHARLASAGMLPEGWHPPALAAAMTQSRPRLTYLIPDFHNPTGALMDDAVRAAVAGSARRHDTVLLIDESWAELAVGEPPRTTPMAAFDGDNRVITVGSASKLWWGGLRVGWIRTTAARVRRLAALRAATDIAGALFEQLVVTRLFERVEEARAERGGTLRASRDALAAALREHLPSWEFRLPEGGGVLWVRHDHPSATALARAAARHGVRLAPGPWFGAAGTLEGFLRLPYTQPPQVLADAVRRIAAAIAASTDGPALIEPLTPAL